MKKFKKYLSILAISGLSVFLTACNGSTEKQDSLNTNESETAAELLTETDTEKSSAEITENPASEEPVPTTEEPNRTEEMKKMFGDNCIAEQTFETTLSEFEGSVYFVPYYPSGDEKDMSIQIIQNGEVLLSPASYVPADLESDRFTSLDAVSFYDVNYDGNTDIVMIKTTGDTTYAAIYYGYYEETFYDGETHISRNFYAEETLSEKVTAQVTPLSISGIRKLLSGGKKNGEFANYQEAYQSLLTLSRLESENDLQYDLLYVDNDDIPELSSGSEGYYVSLYTFHDGTIHTLMDRWPYGAMGNIGYEYSPHNNNLRNENNDYAGLVHYTTYWKIHPSHELETVVTIETLHFDDPDGDHVPSNDEEYLEEGTSFINGAAVTEADYAKYDAGDYEFLVPSKSYDEVMAELK